MNIILRLKDRLHIASYINIHCNKSSLNAIKWLTTDQLHELLRENSDLLDVLNKLITITLSRKDHLRDMLRIARIYFEYRIISMCRMNDYDY